VKTPTKKIFSVHHWCGLVAGIFLLVMSVSGSILVFHDEIDHLFFKSDKVLVKPAGALSFDRSYEEIRQAHPGWEIRVPSLPMEKTEALKYELRKGNLRQWVFVHPETGEWLHTVNEADKRFVHVLLTLHYSFFAGTVGKVLVLFIGIAFLVLLITGLIVYRKSLAKVLLFRQSVSLKSKRSFFSSMHRMVGVWGLVFNILICITGIRIAYVISAAALKPVPPEVSVPPISHSIDELIADAGKAYPAFQVNYLRFPLNSDGKLVLLGRLKSDPSYYGKFYSSIPIDPQTGRVGKIDRLKDKPWLDRLLIILQLLHFGDYAGIGVKILYALGGILPAILSITGFIIWQYRSRPRVISFPPLPRLLKTEV
jgi:uncharacterized iron-regulated membrane protein